MNNSLFEKLILPQLVKASSAIYRTPKFYFHVRKNRHISYPWVWRIRTTSLHPPSLVFPLMSSYSLRYSNSFSEFPTKIIHAVTMVQEITFETKILHPQWW